MTTPDIKTVTQQPIDLRTLTTAELNQIKTKYVDLRARIHKDPNLTSTNSRVFAMTAGQEHLGQQVIALLVMRGALDEHRDDLKNEKDWLVPSIDEFSEPPVNS